MSNSEDKARQQSLTPDEQLHNLIEGLCEEPFELDSQEDMLPGETHMEPRWSFIQNADAFAREHFGEALIADVFDSIKDSPARLFPLPKETQETPPVSGSIEDDEIQKRKKTS